ncbi:flagellar hook protein FlgE [Natronogracilivirga saccharolytica]|uniref:Flagellar hook protein FlgE n=1 Tax=Natronogracilivirga saccharolytica TaxID=2812953 RepID=A0A8J7UUW2_9BACT|nr:flagellar hook protein FlgE [Natronogracilivirga saccharolytica]MBP3191942.1 flagellar hook protein FlgE [Natronogracilivirga saccharolytica]
MALIRALNSGVSGLRSFQTKMDVIGNNIANVETNGFKSSRASFAELMNQNMGRADAGGESSPQMNNQVGLGVRVASIDRDFTQGVMQNTGRGTDLALEGSGYFLVQDQAETYMTRAGNFVFNKDGHLVDQGGRHVQGYNSRDGEINPGGTTENIFVDFDQVLEPNQTEEVLLTGNLSGEAGQERVLNTTIYDNLGNAHSVLMTLEKQDEFNWDYEITFPDGGDAAGGATGTITFDSDGNLTSGSEIEIEGFQDPSSGANAQDFTIRFGDEETGIGFTQYAGSNTAKVLSQDGNAQGQLLDVDIDGEGRLQGIYDNGENRTLAQVALAEVQNDNGLEMVGGGLFRASSAAGEVFINSADNMSDTTINSGSLEGSNVDLAKEFTEMITSQRAYQSSARVISTADEMLMEAVNLKR